MRNNFLSSSLNSVVSLDMDSSWAARSWDLSNSYWNPNTYQVPFKKPTLAEQEPVWPTNLSQGKVRQLFQERRGGKGWDRSYPLEPLKKQRNTNSVLSSEPQSRSLTNLVDASIPLSQTLPDKAFFFTKLPNIGGTMQSRNPESTSAPAKKRISRIPLPNTGDRIKSPSIGITRDIKKLTITPRKPLVDEISVKPAATDIKKIGISPKKDEDKPRITKTANENKNSPSRTPLPSKVRTPAYTPPKTDKVSTNSTPEKVKVQQNSNPDLSQCTICGRSFLHDRLPLHEKICKKSKTKKRKVFDPVKHRLTGTEAETYLKKGLISKDKPTQQTRKSDWRKKHEEFIANIRAAKQVKEHLAKGGKLSDLPPPPPLDTSDYVQCPHCARKFSSGAAERHIPICANMKHNKPKKVNKK